LVERRLCEQIERGAGRAAERLRVDDAHDGGVNLWQASRFLAGTRAVMGSKSHDPGVIQVTNDLRIEPYFLITNLAFI